MCELFLLLENSDLFLIFTIQGWYSVYNIDLKIMFVQVLIKCFKKELLYTQWYLWLWWHWWCNSAVNHWEKYFIGIYIITFHICYASYLKIKTNNNIQTFEQYYFYLNEIWKDFLEQSIDHSSSHCLIDSISRVWRYYIYRQAIQQLLWTILWVQIALKFLRRRLKCNVLTNDRSQ